MGHHSIRRHLQNFVSLLQQYAGDLLFAVNQEHHVRIIGWVRINLFPRISQAESGNQIGSKKLDVTPLKLNTEDI